MNFNKNNVYFTLNLIEIWFEIEIYGEVLLHFGGLSYTSAPHLRQRSCNYYY